MNCDFYNRVGHVEIVTSDTNKVVFSSADENGNVQARLTAKSSELTQYRGLNFKFHIKKICMGSIAGGSAQVSILGLSRESVNHIATYANKAESLMRRLRVRVYAGYEDTGEQLILDGDIMKAVPSVPPNNWINITANCIRYRNDKAFSVSMNTKGKSGVGYKIMDILEAAAKWLELKLVIDVDDDAILHKQVWSFDVAGTKNDIFKELNSLGEFRVWEDNGQLFVGDKNYGTHDNNFQQVISEATGMIGIPMFDWPTAKVKTLINTRIKPFDLVRIESLMIPDASGEYKVIDIEYVGEFRGKEWYQTLSCMRDENSAYWVAKKKTKNIIVKPEDE